MPVAFCRQLLEPAGVTFGSGFVVMDQQNRPIVRGALAELPIFATASARARVGGDSDLASAIAGRSVESDVIRMAERDGGKLDAIQLGDVTFIDLEAFAKRRSDEAALVTTDAVCCEGSSQGWAAAGALAAILVALALNIWAFGGAGYIILIAPFVWFVKSAYHFRVLSKILERRSQG